MPMGACAGLAAGTWALSFRDDAHPETGDRHSGSCEPTVVSKPRLFLELRGFVLEAHGYMVLKASSLQAAMKSVALSLSTAFVSYFLPLLVMASR